MLLRSMNPVTSIWVHIYRAGQLMKVRILLADDHPRFPEMEARLLEPEFEVIGKVGDGQALIDEALRLKPDIIITDISMPILDGIEAVDRLRQSGSKSRIVFLSVHSDTDFVYRCFTVGAHGYVVKSRIASELVPAIRQALAGNTFVSRDMSHHSYR
jgi:DNA-binding NarL/FixJ family response regulator